MPARTNHIPYFQLLHFANYGLRGRVQILSINFADVGHGLAMLRLDSLIRVDQTLFQSIGFRNPEDFYFPNHARVVFAWPPAGAPY